MRRVLVTAASSIAGIVLLLSLKPHHSEVPGVSAPPADPPAPAPSSAPPAAGSRTGTFTGDVITTRYGPVQVRVTVKSGRITDVKVLQAPSDNSTDRRIAAQALPRLKAESVHAQSAHVDAVSGASYTSDGYVRSLQSALDQAHV